MNTGQQADQIGRIYRQKKDHQKRLCFINAELGSTANVLRKAASQLEALLDSQPSELNSALSQLDVNHVLELLAEREQLQRKISHANETLRRFGIQA